MRQSSFSPRTLRIARRHEVGIQGLTPASVAICKLRKGVWLLKSKLRRGHESGTLADGEEGGSFLEQPALETTRTKAAGSLLRRQFGSYRIPSLLGAGGQGRGLSGAR